ncbi:cobyrinate a,c-diamide synthase [Xanthovirga aplysinae]|uniref:cobyrinate a,c-diamide synthase n=1 Tax=Xanthovirga aplysinae TaxID=2529853 RepID=UPI0012BD75C1|nr:cobyrinate a,c-diamide synthase [Xanthovirga aplysinae]MTI31138.1 cobyrinate a,c-diamide synthase [Xanthovirga aplysinae]
MYKPQLIVAAPSSGSGKTMVTCGLLRALSKKGFRVQPYKCGPDYIDPIYHKKVSGKQSVNLDLFMMAESHLKEVYANYLVEADIAVVEGVMGLFDGAVKDQGSTAELAKVLNLPIILVVNAKATAYSVAPLLKGFKEFNPDLEFAGVIFNQVGSENHYRILKEAAEDIGINCLGYLPFSEALKAPSRHLGLHLDEKLVRFNQLAEKAAELIDKHVDLSQLMKVSQSTFGLGSPKVLKRGALKIAVAKDEAFCFTYAENLRCLEEIGQLSFFSPLKDKYLPNADLVYLPGGYPEQFADQLAGNHEMRKAILDHHEKGKAILAECGGLMYIGKELELNEEEVFPMCDLLPLRTSMKDKRLHLGYRSVSLKNQVFKGHEFHFSDFEELKAIQKSGEVKDAKGQVVDMPVFYQDNILASYMHWYWGENPSFFDLLNLNT